MGACDHRFCTTRGNNPDRNREEERDCTGRVVRYREHCTSVWKTPYSETAPGKLMASLADGMDVARRSVEARDITHKVINNIVHVRTPLGAWVPEPRRVTATEVKEAQATPVAGTIRVTNEQGGVKADGGKMQPRLLMQSMPNAVSEICEVLTYGANKYTPDNWKKVEADRYTDALYRHLLAFHAGEQVDSETNKHHLAHAACCILFLLEKQNA